MWEAQASIETGGGGGGGGGWRQKILKFASPETQFREQFFLNYKVHKLN